MNTLRSLQNNFIASVFDSNDNDFSQQVTNNNINGARRLQIYHNNIYIGLCNALSAVYPVVNRLVGDEFFKFMANAYIQQHPSRSGNLHDFGKQLPLFIKNFKPARMLVYLNDVARLEWIYHTVFHAADSSEFEIEKLQQVREANYHKLIFTPNPASQLISSPYPILKIWLANQDSHEGNHDSNLQSENISLDEGETRLLVIRRHLDIEFQSLDDAEFVFLQAFYNRDNFFTACDAVTEIYPEYDISQLLLKHIQAQTLVNCEIQD